MKKYYVTFAIILVFISSQSQNFGKLFIKNYTYKEYNAESQNWAVVQDYRGIMYFGNNVGLLEFDGTEWRTIFVKNNTVVRSLALGKDSIVYVGASNEIGYISPDKNGNMIYFSLFDKIDTAFRNFTNVWRTYCQEKNIFYTTRDAIYRWNGKNIKIFAPEGKFFARCFFANNLILVKDIGKNLKVIKNDSIFELPNSFNLYNMQLSAAESYNNETILFCTNEQGLILYKPFNRDTNITKFGSEEANTFLINNGVYNSTKLKNGNFIFCTRLGGVAEIDKKGNLVRIIDEKDGLLDNTIANAYEDSNNNIWLTLGLGIAYVETSSPYSYFPINDGLSGIITTINKFGNKLYVGTSEALFYLDENKKFQKVEGSELHNWTIEKVSINNEEKILVAHSLGLFELKNNEFQNIALKNFLCYTIYKSKFFKDRIYVGTSVGLFSITYVNKKWETTYLDKFKSSVRCIVEDTNKNIWFGTDFEGVIRVYLDDSGILSNAKIENYDTLDGLPSMMECKLIIYNKKLYAATNNGIFSYDKLLNKFKSDSVFGSQYSNSNRDIYLLLYDSLKQNLWFAPRNNKFYSISLVKINEEKKIDISIPFLRLPKTLITCIYPFDSTSLLIGTNDGLFNFDGKKTKSYAGISNVLIRKVLLNNDSVIFNGSAFIKDNNKLKLSLHQNKNEIFKIEYKYNNVSIYFSAPLYENPDSTLYKYFLEGKYSPNKEWSEWTSENKAVYTNLHEGEYTFFVCAKNTFGIETIVTKYTFVILPPWYRSWWAYAIYCIFTFFIFVAGLRIYTKRLIKQNEKLEKIVAERTKEISNKNAELELQKQEINTQADNLKEINEILFNKNKEILKQKEEFEEVNIYLKSSIKYAETIQKSILPSKSKIDEYFDSFIIYEPKDIVSGDFYWFAPLDKNSTITAVVDCTGHGVPGAFMSMIGNRLLSEIIFLEKISAPDLILKKLNLTVINALKQENSEHVEGMDICLIKTTKKDNNNYFVEFCGAKRNLLYFNSENNTISVIKGTRKSVGGIFDSVNPEVFSIKAFNAKSNDVLYLTTDGLVDQNSNDRMRYGSSRLIKLLEYNSIKTTDEIKQIIIESLNSFKQDSLQRDDITVLGLKLK